MRAAIRVVAAAAFLGGCGGGSEDPNVPHLFGVAPNGEPEQLTDDRLVVSGAAAWAPDGRTIAHGVSVLSPVGEGGYIPSAAVDLIDPRGEPIRRIDVPGQGVGRPAWSPDGRRLAFVGRSGLFIANTRTGDARRIAPGPYRGDLNDAPAWSPGGGEVAVPADDAVVVVRSSGGAERRIPAGGATSNVRWSRDGGRLLFVTQGSSRAGWTLWVVRSKGGRPKPVHRSVGPVGAEWSPDGGRIAVIGGTVEGRVFTGRLHVLDSDGGRSRELASDVSSVPAWSPDGTSIAFIADDRLESVEADGGGRRTLARLRKMVLGSPVWSPDGRRIVFTAVERREG